MIHSVTENCYYSMMLDEWPRIAAVEDFGLEDQEHYEALYDPIRKGEIEIEQLDEVLGSGPKITELVNKCESNRHKGIVFRTPYDSRNES